ncbi:hypothetical protein HDU93_007264 [Gonapodya sp. JEL0774]|nr:hypothetical protein HDU93_007264 [Gonapodya sp. JEL0774]
MLEDPSYCVEMQSKVAITERLARLLKHIAGQPPNLDKVQTLLHVAISLLAGAQMGAAAVAMAECISNVRLMKEAKRHVRKYESVVGDSAETATDVDAQLVEEEESRIFWFVAFFDMMMGAWVSKSGPSISQMELLELPIPSGESLWSSGLNALMTTSNLRTRPTLALFMDPITWPLECTASNNALGSFAFTDVLNVYCFRQVLAYRHKPSNELHAAVTFSLTTWFARFHNELGLPVPEISTSLDSLPLLHPCHDVVAATPWALALFVQYHCMWGLFLSPLPGSGDFDHDEICSGGGNTAPFIRAWVASPSFVICLDHVRIAISALDKFLTLHGENMFQDLLFPGGGFGLSMSVLPLIISAKEAICTYEASIGTSPNTASQPPPQVLLQFLRETRAQILTAIKVLHVLSKGRGHSIMDRGVAEQKQKAKIVEDKTFGLKNKNKSSKVAKYVEQVKKQVDQMGNRKEMEAKEKAKLDLAARKKAEEDKKKEMAELFKPVQTQKVPFGVDPKTVLCQFFKAGHCEKGSKCKFSHDLNIEKKAAKIDLYTDQREKGKEKEKEDTSESWDQSKLESVVKQKHAAEAAVNVNRPTDIVCKFFIDAIESGKYGWFWVCPNGNDKCKYRHALPPGFVLKKKETVEERMEREERERENEISLEEFLETERHNLGPNLTPVTLETFTAWKQRRKEAAKASAEQAAKDREEAYRKQKAGGKAAMQFSGRELFDFNPEWQQQDDGEAVEEYERDESVHEDDDEESDSDENDDGSDAGEPRANGSRAYEPGEGSSAGPAGNGDVVDEDLFAAEDVGDDDDED